MYRKIKMKVRSIQIITIKIIFLIFINNNIFGQNVASNELKKVSSKNLMKEINNLVSLTNSKFQGLHDQLGELKEKQNTKLSKNKEDENNLITSLKAELSTINGHVERLASDQQSYADLEAQLIQKLKVIKENLRTLVSNSEKEESDLEPDASETNLKGTPPARIQNLLGSLEISGFFDMQNRYNLSKSENEGLNYGQFEVDISKRINNYISIEGAIAFNSDDGQFELGAGIIDFHLLDDDVDPPVRGKFLSHSGIIVGQFDVPFGIDYQYIPSPNRKFLTSPLANEKTINSMNDFGVSIYGGSELFNFTFFCLNGFTETGAVVGGRIGICPYEFVEVGTSYMTDLKKLNKVAAKVFGADLRVFISTFEFRSEFILSNGMIEGELDENGIDSKHSSYYIQATNELQAILNIPVFMSMRFGNWNADFYNNGLAFKDNTTRITSAIGYVFTEYLEARIEFLYQEYEKEQRTSSLAAQLVVCF